MADELIDDVDATGGEEEPLSPRRKLVAGLAMAAVVLAAAAVMIRVSSPPIPPDQKEPNPHWGPQCAWCHSVSESAAAIEVNE